MVVFAFYPVHQKLGKWLANGTFEQFDQGSTQKVNGHQEYLYTMHISLFNNHRMIFSQTLENVPVTSGPFLKKFIDDKKNCTGEITVYIADMTSYITKQPTLNIVVESNLSTLPLNSNNHRVVPISFEVKKSLQVQHRQVKFTLPPLDNISFSFAYM